ncbi:hypothetical protein SLEP1_g56885 [Rubroshorea leprosula]|uniref:Translation initiation factor 1 n=1 Tax=Rubroshorea leprosula TaxID=152421 RepID=A0AAV5MP27_9ROSI|nr:hypothetical protein SLEP1_g56885 [Rubroshorea leprosula]
MPLFVIEDKRVTVVKKIGDVFLSNCLVYHQQGTEFIIGLVFSSLREWQ